MMNTDQLEQADKYRILHIDDDLQFSDDLSFLLNGPYSITSAAEAKEGLSLLEQNQYDLVILDLKMPSFYSDEDEKEGLEVLKIIKLKWGPEGGANPSTVTISCPSAS